MARTVFVGSLVVLGLLSGHDALRILQTTAMVAVALCAIVAATKLPMISKPGRWLWRRLVAEPIAAWFHGVLDAWADRTINGRLDWLEGQFRNTGGSTMRDRVDKVASAVGADPAPAPDPEP